MSGKEIDFALASQVATKLSVLLDAPHIDGDGGRTAESLRFSTKNRMIESFGHFWAPLPIAG
jgi:hypothetical protein